MTIEQRVEKLERSRHPLLRLVGSMRACVIVLGVLAACVAPTADSDSARRGGTDPMGELEAAIELIAATAADTRFKGPRPASLIDAAEAKLGVVFPPTYRRFLSEFGCGSVGAFEFYGVDEETHTGILSCVWSTLGARRGYGLPREFVIVADLGDGSFYVLDTGAQTPHGENPVLVWMPTARDKYLTEQDAADFGAFFLSRVREQLDE